MFIIDNKRLALYYMNIYVIYYLSFSSGWQEQAVFPL